GAPPRPHRRAAPSRASGRSTRWRLPRRRRHPSGREPCGWPRPPRPTSISGPARSTTAWACRRGTRRFPLRRPSPSRRPAAPWWPWSTRPCPTRSSCALLDDPGQCLLGVLAGAHVPRLPVDGLLAGLQVDERAERLELQEGVVAVHLGDRAAVGVVGVVPRRRDLLDEQLAVGHVPQAPWRRARSHLDLRAGPGADEEGCGAPLQT